MDVLFRVYYAIDRCSAIHRNIVWLFNGIFQTETLQDDSNGIKTRTYLVLISYYKIINFYYTPHYLYWSIQLVVCKVAYFAPTSLFLEDSYEKQTFYYILFLINLQKPLPTLQIWRLQIPAFIELYLRAYTLSLVWCPLNYKPPKRRHLMKSK